ncbi:hypothetical protein yc1106_03374 [Curvularia clavata]|uniref:Uncharacterized protein n=1 Tax=Curvularia clavata TaxID=95742 RepID=A0A9Q8Z6K7_CURCL|nr:hypothetical protein yc1106_03374 [Curvularia clavata]
MESSPPELSLKIMRGLFTRGDKDKALAELRVALSLLQLSGLEDLEYRFLATEAFLKPWAVFRDAILMLKPEGIADATTVAFDEDMYRHDPWARDDRYCIYIDKKGWGVEEYEKHLFAWLLQTFKVGKSRNPWGFDYFELRNICTAWQAVFVPIVNAVRASYGFRGRRYYGRLALFVEERCPSGLAFPTGHISPSHNNFSTSPHRALFPLRFSNGAGVLTRKHYDETEKELRTVYPQYGGLVERPKFKHRMDEWLEEQRARANLRKAAERAREAKASLSEVVTGDANQTPTSSTRSVKDPKGQEKDGSISPIRRVSNSIRRSISRRLSKLTPSEQPKSPLHGVTRQLYIPDDLPSPGSQDARNTSTMPRHMRSTSAGSSDTTIITPWPRPSTERKSPEQSVYSERPLTKNNQLRNFELTDTPSASRDVPQIYPECISTPFDVCNEAQILQEHVDRNESFSPRKGTSSGIPRLARRDIRQDQQGAPVAPISDQKSCAERRNPSYEGSGWGKDISMMDSGTIKADAGRVFEPKRPTKSTTRLPAPIKPTPYYGQLRAATENSRDASSVSFGSLETARPKPVAWPGTSPEDKSVLAAVNDQDDFLPPIPARNPERRSEMRCQASISHPQQRERSASNRSAARIVSKENIRAALGGHSRDSSVEDVPLVQCIETDQDQCSYAPSGGLKLQTYNTHMFPRGDRRKGTPVGGWVGAPGGRNTTG